MNLHSSATSTPARTSQDWLNYFKDNADRLLSVPWELGAELTSIESAAVARSIAEFQVGESSEGRHLLQYARAYALHTGDSAYLEAMRLFIAEEQRHARELARFLRLHGLPLVKTTASDCVFRWARNVVRGLEVSIAVLVTAELIAQVYYVALQRATGSLILQRICEQILHDEEAHVAFQCGQLAKLRAYRAFVGQGAAYSAQALLLLAAILVVWVTHRPVMRRAHIAFHDWWIACWDAFHAAFEPVRAYGPAEEAITLEAAGSRS